jgi:hypothetical protein
MEIEYSLTSSKEPASGHYWELKRMGESPSLEAATKQQLVKNDKTLRML